MEYVFIGGDFWGTGHAFRLEVRLCELPCAGKPAGNFRESFSRIARDLGKLLLWPGNHLFIPKVQKRAFLENSVVLIVLIRS